MALMRGAAFPTHWWGTWSDELRRIKERVEKERASWGARTGRSFDVKLGPGGLSDIEWTAQWLALKFGHQYPALQAANTRRQLFAAGEAGLLTAEELETLEQTYTWLRRAELRLQIAHEGGAASVKKGSKDATIWARAVFPGLPANEAEARFEAEWNQHTSGSRRIFERIRDEVL
jgi:glutamate-ammonia-ligase adenylyltransferase